MNEYKTVQDVPPTKTTSAVRIIGIDAIFALRLRNKRRGRAKAFMSSPEVGYDQTEGPNNAGPSSFLSVRVADNIGVTRLRIGR